MAKKNYRTYKKERYIFFWMTIIVYFVPVIAVTASLLPMVVASQGTKWGVGCTVMLLYSLVFVRGFLYKLLVHFPFFNGWAAAGILISSFFTLDFLSKYRFTFMWIMGTMFVSGFAACVLWIFHNKYKRAAQTVKTVVKSGVLGGKT